VFPVLGQKDEIVLQGGGCDRQIKFRDAFPSAEESGVLRAPPRSGIFTKRQHRDTSQKPLQRGFSLRPI
jgi:hypothetical protein